MADLGIEPKAIGLTKPIVILDYPNPEYETGKYVGFSLALEDIAKCKAKILQDMEKKKGEVWCVSLPSIKT